MAVREDILAAATEVFGSKGYDRATLEDVAKLVGIKKASLYHHIDSKEELLWELHRSLYAELSGELSKRMSGVDTPTDQLRALIESLVYMLTRRQLATRVMLRAHRSLSGRRLRRVLANREDLLSTFSEVIDRGIRAGEFSDVDSRIAALGLLGMCYWVQEWYDPDGPTSPEDIASAFERLIIEGLAGRWNMSGASQEVNSRALKLATPKK